MSDIKNEEKVLSEINLDHKSLLNGVEHIIDWIRKQPYLPNVTDEDLIKSFIIGSKSIERAKERLDKYFTARTKNPVLLGDRDPCKTSWNQVERMMILPGLTSNCEDVIFFKPPSTKEEIEAFSFNQTCRTLFMLLDHRLKTKPFNSGQIAIIDCKNVGLDLLTKYITSNTASVFNLYQYVLPIRLKAFICFNASSVAETFFNTVLKMFFTEKLQKRVLVYSEDHTVLSQHLPLEMLPNDYIGGKSPSIEKQFESVKKTLESERDWFLKEGSEVSNELKRPKTENSVEQIQGTFRKLEVD